jgi:hypothetical protein
VNDAMVLALREQYAAGTTQSELERNYNLSRATISAIVTGKAWKHVGGPINDRHKRGRRSDKERQACQT